jgi:hypothetical protein
MKVVPAELVLKQLGWMLSFDRPASKEKMVQQSRDLLLVCGYPVANDFRPREDGCTAVTSEIRKALL